jgi:tight adherence protein C
VTLAITALAYSSLAMIALSIAVAVYNFANNPPATPPELGHRGLKRKRALEENQLFRAVEPAVRMVAGWVSHLPIYKSRQRLDRMLVYSGNWLGLTADEVVALCILSGFGCVLLGIVAADLIGFGAILSVFFGALGATMPYTRLTNEVEERFKTINRSLPGAIDLAALCMGAGLDFPGAMRQIVNKSHNKRDPIVEEVSRILQELDLGRTRKQALESFADRCPTEPVTDFVGAIVQAEEKGNPLAEVLRIQASMLRMRRSIMAEEAASRAGVLMIAPLVLMFGAIMMLLLGPFIIKMSNSGF